MKKFFLCVLMSAFFGMSGIAFAEQDMSAFKCSEFLQGDDTAKTMVIFWIDGYMSAQSENTTLSEEWIKKLSMHMGGYCAANPNATLMDAMDAMPAE